MIKESKEKIKRTCQKEREVFCWGNYKRTLLQKNEIRLYHKSHEEINSKRDKNWNVRLEILLIIRGKCKLYGSNMAYNFLGDMGMDRNDVIAKGCFFKWGNSVYVDEDNGG